MTLYELDADATTLQPEQLGAPQLDTSVAQTPLETPFMRNVSFLWTRRATLARVVGWVLVLSAVVAFLLPKQYRSSARIMPPQSTSSGGAAMLAALVGKGSVANGLAGLVGDPLGGRNGPLFISLLRSGTVAGHLIDRFQLQHAYRKRYREDTAKKLASKTTISEDTKSGVITLVFEDPDRQRARDVAAAYLEELNALVARVNTSSARLEREFIEQRLVAVEHDLQQAQMELSAFSSRNTAIDLKEQTRATVESGARLQGQLIASEAELDSLQQVYGAENVRVRAAEARVGVLRSELSRASGGDSTAGQPLDATHPYPSLRQLPALAVPWANLYRRVRIQETVFEMLSAQYETARIEEAKSIPTVRVIDAPGIPEKKALPHRLWIILIATFAAFVLTTLFLLLQQSWRALDERDSRRVLARAVSSDLRKYRPQFLAVKP